MEDDYSDSDLGKLRQFYDYMNEYIEEADIQTPKPDEGIENILGMSYEEILVFSSTQCFAKSVKMSCYAMYINHQIKKNQGTLNHCHDLIEKLVAKDYNKYDPYMKYESRRWCVINDNPIAGKIERIRARMHLRKTLLDDKLVDIRRMADTLRDLGNRKGYSERY